MRIMQRAIWWVAGADSSLYRVGGVLVDLCSASHLFSHP